MLRVEGSGLVQRRNGNVVQPSAWRQQHHNLWAPITCARAVHGGAAAPAFTLNRETRTFPLFLGMLATCSGACRESRGGVFVG
jgi:hypothetical protein